MTTNFRSNPGGIFAADDDHDDLAMLLMFLRKAGVEHPVELYSAHKPTAEVSDFAERSFQTNPDRPTAESLTRDSE